MQWIHRNLYVRRYPSLLQWIFAKRVFTNFNTMSDGGYQSCRILPLERTVPPFPSSSNEASPKALIASSVCIGSSYISAALSKRFPDVHEQNNTQDCYKSITDTKVTIGLSTKLSMVMKIGSRNGLTQQR